MEPWLFHSIELPLTGLDVPPEDLMIYASVMFEEESINPTIMGTEAEKTLERASIMHDVYLGQVVKAWDIKINFLGDFTHLKELAVILIYFCCPHGCCRSELFQEPPIQNLLGFLQDKEREKLEVRFVGLSNKERETLFSGVPGFEDKWADTCAKHAAADNDHGLITDDSADSDAPDESSSQDPGVNDRSINADSDLLSETTSQGDDLGEEDDGSAVRDVSDSPEPLGYDYEILRVEARGR